MFVVYLSSEKDVHMLGNAYGYYTGKCYAREGGCYPITDSGITERTKRYTSRARAEKGAEAVFIKCGYVSSYEVQEV